VQQHLAAFGKSGQRQHTADVTTRHYPRTDDISLFVKYTYKTHLIATGKPNGGPNGARRCGMQPRLAQYGVMCWWLRS